MRLLAWASTHWGELDIESHRVYQQPPDSLPWWRLSALIQKMIVDDLTLDPQLARESVPDQRQRILAALEAPASSGSTSNSSKAREASLERIRHVQRQMVEEPDFDKRMDLRDQMRELSREYKERFSDDDGSEDDPN